MFAAKKLTRIATSKLLKLCNRDGRIQNKEYLALDIAVFIDGLLCEYVKYCRGLSEVRLDDLYAYTKVWIRQFSERRMAHSAGETA